MARMGFLDKAREVEVGESFAFTIVTRLLHVIVLVVGAQDSQVSPTRYNCEPTRGCLRPLKCAPSRLRLTTIRQWFDLERVVFL